MSKQEIHDTNWYRSFVKTGNFPVVDSVKRKVKKGRPSVSENPVADTFREFGGGCTIILTGIMPGLNQLLREHFMARKERKKKLIVRLRKFMLPAYSGPVKITFIGYSSVLSDWENFCGKFKILGDALVDCGVIEDDSPEHITEFIPQQFKSRRKDARVEVTIEKC